MKDDTTKTPETDTRAMLAAGTAIAIPNHMEGGGSFMVVPEGYKLEDIEKFMPAPARARGTITAETPEAFIAYYNRFVDEEASMVFACTETFTATGIIDWHEPEGDPGFAEHRVVYKAPRSDEWEIWTEANKTAMTQTEFSQFIEDNVKDIRSPAGADVLEVARQLEVKKKVEFASAERLSDGQREFTYNEEVEGSTRRGQMKIPEEFKLGIPVFINGALYEVIARLRYRIDGGQLRLWYDLLRPHEIERDAFGVVVEKIDGEVNTPVIMASPSA